MRVESTFTLKPGALAPAFILPDAAGCMHSLEELSGMRGTLVVFACNHCPFVVHLASALGVLAQEAADRGVRTVVINSNDLTTYPQDGAEFMQKFAADHGWDFPYLIDETQQVAKDYAAACTPDFYLFNADLALFYAGQFDDSRPKNGSIATGKDLQQAIDAMLAGEVPPAVSYPASGCNIKWKVGQEPEWYSRLI